MFKTAEKKEVLKDLNEAKLIYNKKLLHLEKVADDNYNAKLGAAHTLIPLVENFLFSLMNYPSEYRQVLKDYKTQKVKMITFAEKLEKESSSNNKLDDQKKNTKKISINPEDIIGGTGVAGGIGFATLGPTAATAIASTYGVASTGAAVSALSGAAAQSAALAWLGGGSLAAGGGGIVAGEALLALLGPVGWVAGGVAIAGTGIYKYLKVNKQIIMAKEQIKKINLLKAELPSVIDKLKHDSKLVNKTHELARHHLNYLIMYSKNNFIDYSEIEKKELRSLIQGLEILAANLNGKELG